MTVPGPVDISSVHWTSVIEGFVQRSASIYNRVEMQNGVMAAMVLATSLCCRAEGHISISGKPVQVAEVRELGEQITG